MDERTIELFARKSGLMELSGAYMKAGLFDGSNMVLGDAMMEFAKMCREYKEPEPKLTSRGILNDNPQSSLVRL